MIKIKDLRNFIIKHEGFRQKPYNDSVGKVTIGVGRNIEDVGLSVSEVMYLLDNDISRSLKSLERIFKPHLYYYSDARVSALVSMVFMGEGSFLEFKKMIQAIKDRDWDGAAIEALDSKWAKQVGKRATEIAEILRTGEFIK